MDRKLIMPVLVSRQKTAIFLMDLKSVTRLLILQDTIRLANRLNLGKFLTTDQSSCFFTEGNGVQNAADI
jgi:hypothetical protein